MLFFQFPEDARWNSRDEAVEFSVVLGPYEGTVTQAVLSRVAQSVTNAATVP